MALEDPRDLRHVDQEIRLNELREKVKELTGGEAAMYEDPNAPPEIVESFFNYVLEYESAAPVSRHELLRRAGLVLPPPDKLDDAGLCEKLWQLIRKLGEMRHFLDHTDHVSDRELYTVLYKEILHEEVPDLPARPDGAWHIDLAGSGSDQDTQTWLRYYADEQDRRGWLRQFPDDILPPHEAPPLDRDRFLPKDGRDQAESPATEPE